MKRWLVLCGGGGCGRWQAGALDALNQAGLLYGLAGIVGTSVGGLNGCTLAVGLAQGKGVEVLKDAWNQIRQDTDVYAPSLTAVVANPAMHPLDDMGLAKGFLMGPAACSTDALAALVTKILGGWDTDKIISLGGFDLCVRALNYGAQRGDTLRGDLAAMALATSAIEGIFPRRWGYGDGGAVDNEPLDVALNAGADQVLVVYCGPEDPVAAPRPATVLRVSDTPPAQSTGLKDALGVLGAITAMNEDLVDQAAGRAEAAGAQVVHCFPPSSTGSALDFSPRGLYERGQKEAALAITQAKALGW